MNIPKGHQTIMPYLSLRGGLKFIEFTAKVFGATVNLSMHKMRDDFENVQHSEIMIDGCTIMFTDAADPSKVQTANLFIYVADADETFKKAVEAGSEVVSGLSNQNYGRTCGVKDPFGNTWWVTSITDKA